MIDASIVLLTKLVDGVAVVSDGDDLRRVDHDRQLPTGSANQPQPVARQPR